jgi:single-strand DNA-binding protein
MSSVNKVILVGNVGSDPEVRYLERGTAIANFNLATTDRGYTMQNGTQVPDRTEWHPIVLWRNLAEWAEKYVRKGMKLYVEGKLQTRTWEKDGQVRRKTEIIAENIQVLYRPADYRSPNNQVEEPVAEQTTSLPENSNIPTLEIVTVPLLCSPSRSFYSRARSARSLAALCS